MRTTNLTKEQIEDLKSEDETFSQEQAHAIETLTGRSLSEVLESKDNNSPAEAPEGHPSTWERSRKLEFIDKAGADEFKRLCRERKAK
ncbi:hypothetical protein ACG2F4_14435 [Halalkalibaculum sp. DA3122]|uniref:hypothetical protein n=1 Tax=Halalkalibaculum sp. DA3122 TaxID=3373607 RepID=UPI0037544847